MGVAELLKLYRRNPENRRTITFGDQEEDPVAESKTISTTVKIDREFVEQHERTDDIRQEVERLFAEAKDAFLQKLLEHRAAANA